MSNPAAAMPPADPLKPPKSIRILGIWAICLSVLSLPLIAVCTFLSAAGFEKFAREFSIDPEPYVKWLFVLAALAVLMCLVELVAGIGLAMRTLWGRTLALVWSIASIVVCLLTMMGFVALVAVLKATAELGNVPGAAEVNVYGYYSCGGPLLAILMMIFLWSKPVRRWVRAVKDFRRDPLAFDRAQAALAGARTAGGNIPAAAAVATASSARPAPGVSPLAVTMPSHGALDFSPPPAAPTPPQAAPMTLHAETPLKLAGEPSAAPLKFGVPVAPAAGAGPAPLAAAPVARGQAQPIAATARDYAPEPVLCKLALLSFIFAFFPLLGVGSIVVFTMGNIALRKVVRSNGTLKGRGFAIAAIIISGCQILLLLVILLIVLIVTTQTK